MRFSTATILFGLIATSIAAPAPKKASKTASATAAAATGATAAANGTASTATTSGANVLTSQAYADFQISDGVAGNAQAEVLQKFPIDMNNLAGVSSSDADIINAARTTAESAETDAFNPAIAAASGDAATALQNGKIKNKVLKLQLEVMGLMIKQAQGGGDQSASIAAETTKLNTNIATDTKNAGQTSQSVTFNG